jgi:hypothetical protein
MKRTIATALFTLATLFTAGSALAQDRGVQANVPFNFTVGGRLLPAGVYTATMPLSGVMEIQSLDKHVTAMTTYTPNVKEQGPGSKWVFQRYGQQYFLHSVISPSASMHASVPVSPLEKQVNRQQASLHGGEPVLVAGN